MSSHAGQAPNANKAKTASCRGVVVFRERVAIGTSGAATQAATVNGSPGYDDPGFTCTKNGTGTYDLTYPKGRRVWIQLSLYSPSSTVVGWVITAMDATAGTATIKTLAGTNAAAATEPASGDLLLFTITVEP
jgi:hypothetical protein